MTRPHATVPLIAAPDRAAEDGSLDFELLFKPVEDVDAWLTGLFAGAPLLAARGRRRRSGWVKELVRWRGSAIGEFWSHIDQNSPRTSDRRRRHRLPLPSRS
jgi:hypothetical protein